MESIVEIMGNLMAVQNDDNATAQALRRRFPAKKNEKGEAYDPVFF
jgi:hypothetical protein